MVDAAQELAQRMLADYDATTPGQLADEPLELTTAQAYALQARIARLREERGEQIIGYKVGCTSRAIQAQLGVSEPIFGRLFSSQCHPSGVRLSAVRFANLAVEGELAVRLSEDLCGSFASDDACRAAIAEVFPVIELHHYVLPAAWPRGAWLVASGGLHAGFVLPHADTRTAGGARRLVVRINDSVVGDTEDAAAHTCPVQSLRWLAGRLADVGLRLHRGEVILTGSPLPLFPVGPGSRVVVDAPPLGSSCVEFDP